MGNMRIFRSKNSKKSYGLPAKPKTAEELDQAYQTHAAYLGRNIHIIEELQAEIVRLEQENENHLLELRRAKLARKHAAAPEKPMETPKKEPST